MDLRSTAGLLRSLLIYYGHPLRHRRLVRLYAPFVRPGDLAFDIGAHLGNHTRALAALGARVVAVEPQPLLAGFMRRAFGRNPNITVLECALDAEVGEGEMHVSSAVPAVSTLDPAWKAQVGSMRAFQNVTWDTVLPVATTNLAALISVHGRPAFCKLDVEGAEHRVLRGLDSPIPALAFEYLPAARRTALACIERLDQLGAYEYNWSLGETARLQASWVPGKAAAEFLRRLPDKGREGNLFARLR